MPVSTVPIVALYAGLNGLILLWLAVHVGKTRARVGVSIGDGGDATLTRAMRGQANFVEYVPLALLQLAVLAAMGTPAWGLHVAGAALTAGRVLHAMHFVQTDAPGWQRAAGAALSMLVVLLASLWLVGNALVRVA